jgi:hypothetical protein
MSIEQYIESTKYLQWEDGMYVMLDDLADPLDEQGYVLALVEDSLRSSRYFLDEFFFTNFARAEDCLGICNCIGGYWEEEGDARIKLTRAQALYIATGETECTK